MNLNYLKVKGGRKMKTEKEIKEQTNTPDAKLCELSDDDLMQVTGGAKPITLPIIPDPEE